MIQINWQQDMTFRAENDRGATLTMDGDATAGLSPMQALLAALAGCTGMDVISILEKKRQKVTGYRIEISGVRPDPGQWPRPYEQITVRHIVSGENIDPDAVARAVQLSDEKYCSVSATLRTPPAITTEWVIEP